MRALTSLDRILLLIHREQPEFRSFDEAQAKTKALRETLRSHGGPEAHLEVNSLAQDRPPLVELLTLIEVYEDLDDDLRFLLKHAVKENVWKVMTISASHGKVCPSPTRVNTDHSPKEH